MSLTGHDMERIADEIYRDRRLTASVYCGRCGYNLRTLPYVYTCPECGNQYNARPRNMKGIFEPQEIFFPFTDFGLAFLGLVCMALIALALGWPPEDTGLVAMAVVLGVLAIIFGWRGVVKAKRFVHTCRVAERVRRFEEELEGPDEEEW